MEHLLPIHEACKAGDAARVAEMLRREPGLVRAIDKFQGTPLHHAGNAAVARLLLDHGADANELGWMGAAPLHSAAKHGLVDVTEVLIAAGANVNARRIERCDVPRGDTPLHWAATEAVARVLVNAGADILARDFSGRTPLHWAAQFQRPAVIRFLLASGTPVDDRDSNGDTALHWAAMEGDVDTIAALLENGADVNALNKDRRTPLHRATSTQLPAIELLVRHGAKLDIRDANGDFPIDARRQGELGLAEPADAVLQELPGGAIQHIRLDSQRREAIVISRDAVLSRWTLDQPPRMLAAIQTVDPRLYDAVIFPDADQILVTTPDGAEIRHGKDLRFLRRFVPENYDWQSPYSLAIAPDGRWIAAACSPEQVWLVERTTGNLTGIAQGGERTMAVRFSPDSRFLATACSLEGGAWARLDEIMPDGSLDARAKFDRNQHGTPVIRFVDTLARIEFSPDGRYLALFETSAVGHDSRPQGWRGSVVLYDLQTQRELWATSIDASLTGDPRSLAKAGHEMGYVTDIAFCAGGAIACGSTRGVVLFLATADGSLVKRASLATEAGVTALAFDRVTGLLFVGLGNGEISYIHPPLP